MWIIYEFQVSICIEFNKNLSLNMKNNTAYFSHISKDFWSPEDGQKSGVLSEVSHSHNVSLQSCDSSERTFPTSSAPRFLVISVSTSLYDASCSRCWRQRAADELLGKSVWLLINFSSLGLLIHCNMGPCSTLVQGPLENKPTTTNNNKNWQLFRSL